MLALLGAGGESEEGAFGRVVADVVHLEGGVFDAELVCEQLFEVAAAGVAVLVPADEGVGGEGVSVTAWDSREDAEAYEMSGTYEELVAKFGHFYTGPARLTSYEVRE